MAEHSHEFYSKKTLMELINTNIIHISSINIIHYLFHRFFMLIMGLKKKKSYIQLNIKLLY